MKISRRTLLHSAAGASALSAFEAGCSSPATESPTDAPTKKAREVFLHGVASGDPTANAVILWTRVTSAEASVEVSWEIATDVAMKNLVKKGSFTTSAARDYTVKVDATDLAAGTTHYYRFVALGETSRIGRTKTAPSADVDRLRFGVVSCASYAHGYFHGYADLAEALDLDAILHLGDYIYEYGSPATTSYGNVRKYEPINECITLADYRTRHALYKRDDALMAIHRQHPFVCIWDDHETANNSWKDGAQNHDANEGSWPERRRAGEQAYSEWMPIRDQADGRIFRRLAYGGLVDLFMLDTRLWGRDEQVTGNNDPKLNDPARTLLGNDQETWLKEQLLASKAKWKVLGQQVMMGQLPLYLNQDQWDGYPEARKRLFQVIVDGKPSELNVITLTGDIHSSWAMELTLNPMDPKVYDRATSKGAIGVEFVTPGITSPGFSEQLAGLGKSIVEDSPHMRYAEITKRGYIVLDLDHDRAQAAFYQLAYQAIDSAERQRATFATAWAVKTGTCRLEANATAATPLAAFAAPAPDDADYLS
jgi:alkaline phosphatase D